MKIKFIKNLILFGLYWCKYKDYRRGVKSQDNNPTKVSKNNWNDTHIIKNIDVNVLEINIYLPFIQILFLIKKEGKEV